MGEGCCCDGNRRRGLIGTQNGLEKDQTGNVCKGGKPAEKRDDTSSSKEINLEKGRLSGRDWEG